MLDLKRMVVTTYVILIVLLCDLVSSLCQAAKWVVVKLGSVGDGLHLERAVTVDKLDAINEDWYLAVIEREQATRERAWERYIKQVQWSEEREQKANKRYNTLNAALLELLYK